MMIPTVHMNGTSKDALTEAIREAVHAIHEAGRLLAATYPNGRDYYPQGNDAVHTAMKEHDARMQKLRDVVTELETLHEAILDGGHKVTR